jgi:hypothetical protein
MASAPQEIDWPALKQELEVTWAQIPKPFRSDRSVHGTLQCYLYGRLCRSGYRVVANFMPPRVQDRCVELIALDADQHIRWAICLDTVITLAAVKSLSSFEADSRLILTTGALEKKVQESRFFLKPGVEHMHLQPAGKAT